MSMRQVLDHMGDVGGKLLPWGILGFMTAGIFTAGSSDSIQRLVQQNGGVLFLAVIAMPYLSRAIEAQKKQAEALTELSVAVRALGERDNYQQREMLGVLHVMAEDIRDVKMKVEARGK